MIHHVEKDGYVRRVWEDSVLWHIKSDRDIVFVVARFPFVEDYHLCMFVASPRQHLSEYPMQQFKTLSEALAVLRVLDASTPRNSDD